MASVSIINEPFILPNSEVADPVNVTGAVVRSTTNGYNHQLPVTLEQAKRSINRVMKEIVNCVFVGESKA